MLYLHVTTRIPERKNADLFSVKGGRGFPTFMFLGPKGGVLASRAGGVDVDGMTKLHDKANKRREAYAELQKKAEAGDAKAKQKLDVWDLEMTSTTIEEFRKLYPDISKLDEDLRDSFLGIWGDATMAKAGTAFGKVVGRDRSKFPEGAKVAAPIILAAAKQGAEPTTDRGRSSWFWMLGMGGEATDNVEMLKLAIAGLEEDAEANPQMGNMVEKWTAKLKTLQPAPEEPEETEETEKAKEAEAK